MNKSLPLGLTPFPLAVVDTSAIRLVTVSLARSSQLWQYVWWNYYSNVQACIAVIEAWWWRRTECFLYKRWARRRLDQLHAPSLACRYNYGTRTTGNWRRETPAKWHQPMTEPISKMFAASAASTTTARWFIDISVVRPTNSISGSPWRHVLFIASAPTSKIHDDDQHSDPTRSTVGSRAAIPHLESQ